jgi:hypothetical protein
MYPVFWEVYRALLLIVSILLLFSSLHYLWFLASRAWNFAGKIHKPEPPGVATEKIVFIAHSFDEVGNVYASRLAKLFDLLGFEVLSGQGFSPKGVSQKVKERLRVAKIIVAVFSEKDDFTWLWQEASLESREKPLFVLLEEGLQWKAGIHGDIEYIKFPQGNIDTSFVEILEGLDDLCLIESYRRKKSIAFSQIKTLRNPTIH